MIDLMSLTPDQVERLIHIQSVIAGQNEAAAKVRAYRDYYNGDHPIFLSDRQKEFLGEDLTDGDIAFSHNVTRLVVDMIVDRLAVVGVNVNGKISSTDIGADRSAILSNLLWQWWHFNRGDILQNDVHRASERDGASYIIVDFDNQVGAPRWRKHEAFDGATGIVVHRDPTDTSRVLMATLYFREFDLFSPGVTGPERKTVYLPGEVRKYRRMASADPMATGYAWKPHMDAGDLSWPLPWVDASGQPLGIPVIEFSTPAGSEVANVAGLQNALNKTWLDLLAAADTAGFPILSIEYDPAIRQSPEGEDDNDLDGADEFDIGPGRAIEIFGGKLHRVEGANLDSLTELVWSIINAIAVVTRVPQHDLRPLKGIQFPSGESLKGMEASLVKKVETKQQAYGSAWADVWAISIKVQNAFGTNTLDAAPMDVITPKWAHAGTKSDKLDAETAMIHKNLGVPPEAVWQKAGYTPEQVASFQDAQARIVTPATGSA